MIIVTGGAGFIGTNVIRRLNESSTDVVMVDTLSNDVLPNVSGLELADYISIDEFITRIKSNETFGSVDAIVHQGACSDTMVTDGDYVMENNYAYSKHLYEYCRERSIRFVYASSASVYGAGTQFREERSCEKPLNLYGYSKWMFDQYIRRREGPGSVSGIPVGLRYFNVFGPHEQHKGRMASVVQHFTRQLNEVGRVSLFEGSGGYGPGGQRRDFVYIDDVVDANLHFIQSTGSGIYNIGTGRSRSFNAMARAVISSWHRETGKGEAANPDTLIDYIDFPEALVGRYQSFTEADLTMLRRAGFERTPTELEDGVDAYVRWLVAEDDA